MAEPTETEPVDDSGPVDETGCPAVLTDDEEMELEITALVAIVDTFGKLSPSARRRVLRWATSRFLPDVGWRSK